jgi:hypothetical protein
LLENVCNFKEYTKFKTKCLCFLPEIVSCSYTITVARIVVIDWNSIASKCIGLKLLYSSVSTTFYFAKGHIYSSIVRWHTNFKWTTKLQWKLQCFSLCHDVFFIRYKSEEELCRWDINRVIPFNIKVCNLTSCSGLQVQNPIQAIKLFIGPIIPFTLTTSGQELCRCQFCRSYLESVSPTPSTQRGIEVQI